MQDNPFRPPLHDRAAPQVAAPPVVVGDGARLCTSVGWWMRIGGVMYLALGVLALVPGWRLLGFISVDTLLSTLWWCVPELLVVAAGIWLLRGGGAMTRVGAGDGGSRLAAAFVNLRWHLIAVGLAPLVQLGAHLDPWGVLP
jgi:hypothetical protein